MILLAIFIFGTIIGSFLNVVIFRLDSNSKKVDLGGRSKCLSCQKKLSWSELVPIFSFVFQKGKCYGCGKKISWQYPIVELVTGFVFLILFLFVANLHSKFATNLPLTPYSLFFLTYLWAIFSILIAITVYDIKHKIIPDSLSFLFSGISFFALLLGVSFVEKNILNLLAGIILALPFVLLWLVSKGEWIGLGDAKLVLGIGWFMGLIDGISSVILAFWIGSVFGVSLILISKISPLFFKNKNFTIKSEIPFAPFLILGVVLIFFFGWDVLGLKLFNL